MSIEHASSTQSTAASSRPASAPAKSKNGEMERRLGSAAWALLFIWAGIAVMVKLSWGWSLLGVGVIILGEQAARWRLNFKTLPGSIACGAIFVVGGLWQIFTFSFPLAPLLLIAIGAVILWNGFFGKTEA